MVSPFFSTIFCHIFSYCLIVCISLFFQLDLGENEETDDESCTLNENGSEDVQNDAVVKLEEVVQYWKENSPQATADSLPPVSDSDNIQNVVVKLEEVVDLDEINPRSPSTAPHVFDSDIRNVDVNMEEIADLEEGNLQRAEKPSTAGAQTALDVDAQDVVVKL